ncbi:MAG: UDP-glucose 4-epimerase GalE [Candidatus Methanomethylophilaceae archaeon]|nr:UDP-glucose 4-epimerase GalE [Candidatus Methanomethylophilaceae archaeon]
MILVTGGAGYIGSHCALRLIEDGHDIVIFDSLELGHVETVDTLRSVSSGSKVEFVKGDLKNRDDIASVFSDYDIDAVVHFAAYSQVAESMRDPEKYYYNNVYGTLNLLSAMRDAHVDRIVFSSTAATYGEPEYCPIDENHPQRPINPYGNSKLTVERIMDDYDSAYGIRSVRLRYFNVVGADGRIGEWHVPETHLVPNVLKSVLSPGGVFSIFGTDYDTRDGTCVRDYIDIHDLIEAHILALGYLEGGGRTDYFNLGTNDGSTVREVFSECEAVVGSKIPVKECARRPGDPAMLIANNTKARDVLGWVPKHTLNDSVGSAWDWERKLSDQ